MCPLDGSGLPMACVKDSALLLMLAWWAPMGDCEVQRRRGRARERLLVLARGAQRLVRVCRHRLGHPRRRPAAYSCVQDPAATWSVRSIVQGTGANGSGRHDLLPSRSKRPPSLVWFCSCSQTPRLFLQSSKGARSGKMFQTRLVSWETPRTSRGSRLMTRQN